jgi:hypothetical protein
MHELRCGPVRRSNGDFGVHQLLCWVLSSEPRTGELHKLRSGPASGQHGGCQL